MEGRGREMAHRAVDRSSRKLWTAPFDYLLFMRKGVFTGQELESPSDEEKARDVLQMLSCARLEV